MKSVSRFSCNTVDPLTTVRMLKEIGVEIYFDKENIEHVRNLIRSSVIGLVLVPLFA